MDTARVARRFAVPAISLWASISAHQFPNVAILVGAGLAAGQAQSVLRITVLLADTERGAMAVSRHALLISDNPATAEPRRVLTAADGSVVVRLKPGNYTVESDRPVAFGGKAYQWTQMIDVVAGRDAILALTAENAEIVPLSAAPTGASPVESDPSFLLSEWQDSVVALWTPTTRASGFVVDAKGLVATTQRIVGDATRVEVQLTPAVKVAAKVLVTDPVRDIAILRIDAKAAATVRPIAIGCGQAARPAVKTGQEIFAIGVPMRGQKLLSSGPLISQVVRAMAADFALPHGAAGGPAFTADGAAVGITTVVDDAGQRDRDDTRIVRLEAACEVIASAEKKMKGEPAPDGTHLPVEPATALSEDALSAAADGRTGGASPYQMSSSDFDIALITPVLVYAARHPAQTSGREPAKGARRPDVDPLFVRPIMDFSNWSEYVAGYPPVLLIRVTPKLVEGFWTKVARAAASTQGVALPPIKRFTSGFSRMRAFCGDAEVTPIHPFMLVQRVSESDAIYEGLYAFDPGALGPHCGSVRLELFSEKSPDKADSRVVDPKVIERIWQDFTPYRPK